jgi:uncharacterized UBP type Zn finger protein
VTPASTRGELLLALNLFSQVCICLIIFCCRSKEEMYRHLSIDVGEDIENDPWTVKRGLEQFFQPEKRELKCEKCSEGVFATQTTEIISW